MTLQDDLAAAFVENMRDVVHGLSQEDPVGYHLEPRVGDVGWADVSVSTKTKKLLFEIKTNIRDTPHGEVHDAEVGSSLRQLKKYADEHPEDIVSIIIPLIDVPKWVRYYANEGIHVVTWYATRILKCPRCHREYRIPHEELTAPGRCDAERCGYEGRFEQAGLQRPIFGLYGAVEVKPREPRERPRDEVVREKRQRGDAQLEVYGPLQQICETIEASAPRPMGAVARTYAGAENRLSEFERSALWNKGDLPSVSVQTRQLEKIEGLLEKRHLLEDSTVEAWGNILRKQKFGTGPGEIHELELTSFRAFCANVKARYEFLRKQTGT